MGLTETEAADIALREVRSIYGADVTPLTEPTIITPETQSASVQRRFTEMFTKRPDLLENFNRHMEKVDPFKRWSRAYVVRQRAGERLGLVAAEVDLATGKVSVSQLVPGENTG